MGMMEAPHPEKQWDIKASECELCGLHIYTQMDCLMKGQHLSWRHLMQKYSTKMLINYSTTYGYRKTSL